MVNGPCHGTSCDDVIEIVSMSPLSSSTATVTEFMPHELDRRRLGRRDYWDGHRACQDLNDRLGLGPFVARPVSPGRTSLRSYKVMANSGIIRPLLGIASPYHLTLFLVILFLRYSPEYYDIPNHNFDPKR